MSRIAFALFIALSGCAGDDTPSYVNGLILRDRLGCAFTAQYRGLGDVVFLTFNRQESSPTCHYPTK